MVILFNIVQTVIVSEICSYGQAKTDINVLLIEIG